jgi:hypothetical protein
MNKQPRSKREQIAMAILGTGVIAAAIWVGLLQPQRTGLKNKLRAIGDTQEKLRSAQRTIRLSENFQAELTAAQQRLEALESRMPAGDVYRWTIRTLGSLQTNEVEIGNLEPPRIGDNLILPKVGYKTASFAVTGTAYYHSFGIFLARLENDFPHIRLQRLELEPIQFGEPVTDEQEKLNFRIEAVALIKASSTGP